MRILTWVWHHDLEWDILTLVPNNSECLVCLWQNGMAECLSEGHHMSKISEGWTAFKTTGTVEFLVDPPLVGSALDLHLSVCVCVRVCVCVCVSLCVCG